MMALTVTPYFAAIEPRVSPAFTLYLKGVAVAAAFDFGVEVRGRGGVMVTIRVVVGNGTSINGEGDSNGLAAPSVEDGVEEGETFDTVPALNAWLAKRPRTRQKMTNASTKLAAATQ